MPCRLSVIFPAFNLSRQYYPWKKIKHLLIVYLSLTRCLKNFKLRSDFLDS
jgi:hypothetical protein